MAYHTLFSEARLLSQVEFSRNPIEPGTVTDATQRVDTDVNGVTRVDQNARIETGSAANPTARTQETISNVEASIDKMARGDWSFANIMNLIKGLFGGRSGRIEQIRLPNGTPVVAQPEFIEGLGGARVRNPLFTGIGQPGISPARQENIPGRINQPGDSMRITPRYQMPQPQQPQQMPEIQVQPEMQKNAAHEYKGSTFEFNPTQGPYVDTPSFGQLPVEKVLFDLTPPLKPENEGQSAGYNEINEAHTVVSLIKTELGKYVYWSKQPRNFQRYRMHAGKLLQLQAQANAANDLLTSNLRTYRRIGTEGRGEAADRGFANYLFDRYSRGRSTSEAQSELRARGVEVKYDANGRPYGSPINTPEGRNGMEAARREERAMASGYFSSSNFNPAVRPTSYNDQIEASRRERVNEEQQS